ncbi:MAG: hypothetical protein ACK6A5_14500 [Flavobacteriales bacterium]
MSMTIPQRKAQLKKLIDSVKDPAVLDRVAKVLEKPVRQSAMVKRALKAEEDLKAGRVHSWDEVSAERDQLIDSLYSEKKSPSRAGRSKRAV